ncbi:MAG: monooxygenase FAD-binding protein [Frankiales bacterium]|nr:monooxygenase FAD-binding protein [Frankiales bacterium]
MDHAVVVGGGIAGLLAARVLSDYFERVTIFERDELTDVPEARRGVPQGHHNHVLLAGGRAVLEKLLPGLGDELLAGGAVVTAPWPLKPPDPADTQAGTAAASPRVLLATRPMLEWQIRKRVAGIPNVTVLAGVVVNELLPGIRKSSISGVEIAQADDGSHTQAIVADLVVDASGRGSSAPQWLTRIGFQPPTETTFTNHSGYASRLYHTPADPDGDRLIIGSVSLPTLRSANVFPVEDGKSFVQLVGIRKDYPPRDDVGFREFVASIPSPEAAQVLDTATPADVIHISHSTENRIRRYHRGHGVEGFIVVGDSACALNPAHGQGMTVAAIAADLLGTELRRISRRRTDRRGFSRRYQRRLARATWLPWTLSTGTDYVVDRLGGGKPLQRPATRILLAYIERVAVLSLADLSTTKKMEETTQLVRSSAWMLAPTTLTKVLVLWRKLTADNVLRMMESQNSTVADASDRAGKGCLDSKVAGPHRDGGVTGDAAVDASVSEAVRDGDIAEIHHRTENAASE